jgi:hypothetical protein
MMAYRPATALVTSWQGKDEKPGNLEHKQAQSSEVLIAPEDLPELLGQVAMLIGTRASRRATRSARHP